MAIKTREFIAEYGCGPSIDGLINEFLSLVCIDELIDIKYQTTPIDLGGEIIVRTSALVIYKKEEE